MSNLRKFFSRTYYFGDPPALQLVIPIRERPDFITLCRAVERRYSDLISRMDGGETFIRIYLGYSPIRGATLEFLAELDLITGKLNPTDNPFLVLERIKMQQEKLGHFLASVDKQVTVL